MEDIVYKGKIVHGNTTVLATVTISNGIITGVYGPLHSVQGQVELDFTEENKYVLIPGVIDIHAHLMGLKYSYKEDGESGLSAAGSGGIVVVVDSPNTLPQVKSVSVLEEKLKSYVRENAPEYYCYAGVPDSVEEAWMLAKHCRVLGFEVIPEDLENIDMISNIAKIAASTGKIIVFNSAQMRSSEERCEAGFRWIDRSIKVEREYIKRVLEITEDTGVRVHFTHMTCRSGVLLAKIGGATVDTSPHYLLLDCDHEKSMKCLAKVDPPLRPEDIVEGLVEALIEGWIDAITSNHTPHSVDEKSLEFNKCPPGIPGLETLIPLMWTFVEYGVISIKEFVNLTSRRPAEILGLKGYGSITPGSPASLTIINIGEEFTINPAEFKSKAKYSPFKGLRLKGKPSLTIVKGNIVFSEDELNCI